MLELLFYCLVVKTGTHILKFVQICVTFLLPPDINPLNASAALI